MLSALRGLAAKAQTMAHKFNNATFKDGVMSACALIALAIANADGEFEDAEKKVVGEICRELGLNAANYI